jgi:Tfp pilus assembly protein PilV
MTRLDLRSESGFTLVELLVATAIGMVVSTATLAIVITSVHFSSNYADRVDATQQGRIAMQKITQLLNSSCVAASVAPILATSDANNLWFYSALGDNPTITPSEEEVSVGRCAEHDALHALHHARLHKRRDDRRGPDQLPGKSDHQWHRARPPRLLQ